jgi:hypothetical protein
MLLKRSQGLSRLYVWINQQKSRENNNKNNNKGNNKNKKTNINTKKIQKRYTTK